MHRCTKRCLCPKIATNTMRESELSQQEWCIHSSVVEEVGKGRCPQSPRTAKKLPTVATQPSEDTSN